MSDVIERLQGEIDAEHRKATEALEVLKKYLNGVGIAASVAEKLKANASPRTQTGKGKKLFYKDIVLGAISDHWATLTAIVETTGLSSSQVRGVLNAPKVRDLIERRTSNDKNEYRRKMK